MKSFVDFLSSTESGAGGEISRLLTSPALSQPVTQHLVNSGLFSNHETREDFKRKATELVEDPNFQRKLSDEIGVPLDTETEQEFVVRASVVMKSLLLKWLR